MKIYLSILLILLSLNLFAQQDSYFADFCLAFEKFELSLLEYQEYKAGEDTNGRIYAALVNMTQQYHTMLRMYDEAAFKYRRSPIFDTISRPHYLQVIDETEIIMESDLTLRKMKQMVQAMVSMQREGFPREYDDLNKTLGRLHFRDYFREGSFDQTNEGYLVLNQIRAIEAYVLRRYFEPFIEKVASRQDIDRPQAAAFKNLTENTNCVPCREEAVPALLDLYRHVGLF